MNRRTSLELLLGKSRKTAQASTTALVTTSFDPYEGPWEWEHAAHLLRRTTFGATKAHINQAVTDGLDTTVDTLFQVQSLPDPPIYYDYEDDPLAAIGETWINELQTPELDELNGARKRSAYSWSMIQIKDGGMNIREKMVLFWHNHFVTANLNNGRQMFYYMNSLRENALGNFKTLTKEITINSAMLVYLNGTQNRVNGPNENYARELLELFTLGKGPAVATGDYTNYTEEDIVQLARALTGWRHFVTVDDINDLASASYVASRHDTGDKQLSHRFDYQIIPNSDENEYKTVIDIIFQKEEVAHFISRKLYRWFVHSDITSEIESNIIAPMAQMLIDDDYEVANALKALLSSEHFYDMMIRGCMLSHPIDHLFKIINSFELAMPEDILTKYKVFKHLDSQMRIAEMGLFKHPTVAGWKAFYQTPQYDKLWINAVTLPLRQRHAGKFSNGYNSNGFRLEIDVLSFAASMENPTDPNDLINEIASIIFVHPLTDDQVTVLKDILIPGLPDFEWTVEYGSYIAGDESLEDAVENQLKDLIETMINMPDFQLT